MDPEKITKCLKKVDELVLKYQQIQVTLEELKASLKNEQKKQEKKAGTYDTLKVI